MKKYDKVTIKDMPMSDLFALHEQDRETIEMFYGEVGVVMAVGEGVVKVAYPSANDFEMIHKTMLEVVEDEVIAKIKELCDTTFVSAGYGDLQNMIKEVIKGENK